MPDDIATVSREVLYEQVWTLPMTKLARQYGVSDVALRKTCRKENIPLPVQGWWNRPPERRTNPRPPLPPSEDLSDIRITRSPPARPENGAHPAVEACVRALASGETRITVPEALRDLHPAVWPKAVRKDAAKDGVSSQEARTLPVNVGKDSQARALRILDALAKALEARGYPVTSEGALIEGKRVTARYVLNFATEMLPRWIVVENVLHMKGWDGYRPLVSELAALGYNILPQELDASKLGVPQKRQRLFLLCDRWRMPGPVSLRRGKPRSARGIIDMSDRWKSRPVGPGTHAPATLARIACGISALGRGVPFLVVYYGSDGSGGWQPLDRSLRTLTTLDRFGLLTWDGCTPMLRMLQVPELKAAMGFGPDFVLDGGSRRDRIRTLGNGVCPPVMEAIVSSLTGQTAPAVRNVTPLAPTDIGLGTMAKLTPRVSTPAAARWAGGS